MGKDSSIQWTDHTWPVTTGCDDASPGCLNCYSKVASYRMGLNPNPKVAAAYGGTVEKRAGVLRWTGLVKTLPDRLDWPLRWRKSARIFVGNMSDLFHEDVPDEFIAAVFGVMASRPEHTFQILTKRADRLPEWFAWIQEAKRGYWHGENGLLLDKLDYYSPDTYAASMPGYKRATRLRWPDLPDPVTNLGDSSLGPDWPLPNVHLGISVEDQARADERIPHLLRCPAAVRFLSVEPQLGPVDIPLPCPPEFETATGVFDPAGYDPRDCAGCGCPRDQHRSGIHWVIVGGESGPHARPFDLAWARSIRDQCAAAGVAFFMKQLGADPFEVIRANNHHVLDRDYLGIKDSHGGDWDEWDQLADLRVREFPRSEVPA